MSQIIGRKLRVGRLVLLIREFEGSFIRNIVAKFCYAEGVSERITQEYLRQLTGAGIIEIRADSVFLAKVSETIKTRLVVSAEEAAAEFDRIIDSEPAP